MSYTTQLQLWPTPAWTNTSRNQPTKWITHTYNTGYVTGVTHSKHQHRLRNRCTHSHNTAPVM